MTDAALPAAIDGYRILRLLGEGGMGRVYLAEQPSPRRQVALKVLRGASASADFRRRFAREIELMASLDHPGLARVHAAGEAETDAGRVPYLVMEYVDGEDLLAFVDRTRPSTRAALTLLATLCRAVHAAHTQGVIHRDLKPANVMVSRDGQPKVLDFGVARMVTDGVTRMTHAGELLGTLGYMSWEQLVDHARVDARSDVYALGVIAYRVLAGRHPYPGLAEQTLVAAVRTLADSTPSRLADVAAGVPPDVSTIVMKAMARDPGQRYGSAAELAADLERYLAGQPIEARPPTAGYLLGLMVRRHKALAAAAAVAVISLVAGAGAATWFAIGQAAARAEAEQRTAEAVAANNFLQDMFATATPAVARGRDLDAVDVLDFARASLAEQPDRYPPRVRAELKRGLGMSYNALGQLRPAQGLLDESLALAAQHFEPATVPMLRIQNDAARVMLNRGEYHAAEDFLQPILAALPDDKRLIEPRLALVARLAHAICEQQRFAECDALLQPGIAEARAALGADHDTTLEMMQWRCFALAPQARYDEIGELATTLRDALVAKYGADHPRTFEARRWLVTAAQEAGDLDTAARRMAALLDDQIRVQGGDTIDIAATRHRYGMLLMRREDWAAAEPQLRAAWAVFERERGVADVGTLVSMIDLATVLAERGDEAAARALRADVVARMDAMDREITSPDVSFYGYYAADLDAAGRHAEALALYARMEPLARKLKFRTSPSLGIFISNMGQCLANNGELDRARAYLTEAVDLLTGSLGSDHALTREAAARLSQLKPTAPA